ncbi:MAG: hypothetical protein ACRD9L_17940 [Bryobacteraceae bacterium]
MRQTSAQWTFPGGIEVLENVLRIYSRGDEFRAFPPHRAEQSFAALVDKRHFTQVDNTSSGLWLAGGRRPL